MNLELILNFFVAHFSQERKEEAIAKGRGGPGDANRAVPVVRHTATDWLDVSQRSDKVGC